MRKFLTAVAVVTVLLTPAAHSSDALVKLPENYATTYTNYLSLDRVQNPDQIIRLFANDIAMQGPGENGELPYGSILVAEVFKAKKDAEGNIIESTLGRRIRDKMALIAIMQKEQGWGAEQPDGLKNGDWAFAAFKPDGSESGKVMAECRACHSPLAATDHLFSLQHFPTSE